HDQVGGTMVSDEVTLKIPFIIITKRRQHRSTLFPYTTLFRSDIEVYSKCEADAIRIASPHFDASPFIATAAYAVALNERETEPRSEEHTSELQSRENLVCRLLLEKKNNK